MADTVDADVEHRVARTEHQQLPLDFVDDPPTEPQEVDNGKKRRWARPTLPKCPKQKTPDYLERRKDQRRRKRAAEKGTALDSTVSDGMRSRLGATVSKIKTEFNTDALLESTSGYLGMERVDESVRALRQEQTLADLTGKNSPYHFEIIEANIEHPFREPTLFTDSSQRVFAARVPPPSGDPRFLDAAVQAADVLEQYRPVLFNENEPYPGHRRGDFAVKAVGVSFGGGQKKPKRIYHPEIDLQLLTDICEMSCITRLAGHASTAFQTWAPNLYDLYVGYMKRLKELFPDITFNFSNSVFACCTLNFGPQTVTIEHLDNLNYIFGWCAITALGSFDHRAGGHFVLWDLKQVVELPVGWTMLIPSSYLRHSNTRLQPGEKRYSLTQYTAGGLFRVIDNEGKTRKKMSRRERAAAEKLQALRLSQDLNCYSTLEQLGVAAVD
ncbi:hypothetical protein EV360DRAFT_71945 [Lentinula raphanica]|nr:hypothetical protein EV360DRAFT_71945 [Lentinula raphanica]